jgi:hypothetical protein
MGAESLSADEIEVEAEYFASTGDEEPSIGALHSNLMNRMQLEGFQPENPERVQLGASTIKYRRPYETPGKSVGWRIKRRLGLSNEQELHREAYLDHLGSLRDDTIFKLRFRFFPLELEDENGIRIEITAEPAIYHKHEQVRRVEDYNPRNAVRNCKKTLEDIQADMGWHTWREPRTPAENFEPTLSQEVRAKLEQTRYGHKVSKFADEGDECLRYRLHHSALGSYIHGIEWAIICYLEVEKNRDLIQQEKSGGFGFDYGQLLKELRETGAISQTSWEDLNRRVTERRWMGHHKEGEIAQSNVKSVKDRFEILTQKLFL